MWNALTSDLTDQYMLNVGFRVSRKSFNGIKELFGHIYGQFGWHILQCYVNIVKKSNVVKRRYPKWLLPKLKQKSIGKTTVESCSGLQWNVEFYSVIKFSTNPLSYTPLKHYATLSHHALTLSE